MSNEEDQCFQCQELGNITCHCPNVWCFECDEYGHIAVDCPDRIPPLACLHTIRDNTLAQGIMPDQLLDTTTGTGIDIAGQDHSHTLTDIKVTVIIIHRIHSRSHNRCHHRSTSWHCHSSTHHYCPDIPHQRSSSCKSSLNHSRDCSRSRPHTSYKPSKNISSKSSSSSSRTTIKPQDKKQRRVMRDYPQSDFYSSDDTSSASEDDLN